MLPRELSRRSLSVAATILAAACASPQQPAGTPSVARPPTRPTADYWVYVAAESADLLHRIRFGPQGAVVEHTVNVGELPDETDGPHGLRISPDGRHLYMTTAHGFPTGKLWKLELGSDSVVAEPILLGRFPATLDLTPDGLYAVVGNFNLHGEAVPSTLSTVYTPDMVEVAQTTTCVTPHGVRIASDGRHAYSACVRDDRIVEMDTRTFAVTRQFTVARGMEGPIDEDAADRGTGAGAGAGASATCSPTWAQPSTNGAHIYVACNVSDEILEISRTEWRITRRWATGRGPYNLTVSPDGSRLVTTLRPGAGVQAIDLRAGTVTGAMPTSGPLAHGVVVSPDGRYAFVTVEDVGMTPGKVDVFALPALTRVATVEVGQQAGGIAFWKMEPAR